MNFKIENNYINITNYPSIEEHFVKMASEGWLITKIIMGSIFIYRKIKPEKLDFSITPYEVETAFTRKGKEELEEFQSVCEAVGWNYATKSGDLHIYFKQKGSEATDLETDDEVEFNTIERIAKRQLFGMYLATIIVLFTTYFLFFHWFDGVLLMRDGFIQLVSPLFPIFLILAIVQIMKVQKFLKINKKNIEIGNQIEYKNSKFYFEKSMYVLTFIMSILFIFHIVYVGIILKNNTVFTSILPIFIGMTIGSSYRMFVKPSKTDSGNKVIIFVVGFIVIFILVSIINMSSVERFIGSYNNLDPDKYKVLTAHTFGEKEKTYDILEEKILQEISLLVPKSYEYAYVDDEDRYIKTEYSNVLTEDLGKSLVKWYIQLAKDNSERYSWSPKASIEGDKGKLWNLEEVYFLNDTKTEIVIRQGKEVFYLDGKDFSDPEIVKIVKDRLDL